MNTSYPTHNLRMRQLLQPLVSQWLTRRIGGGKSLKFSYFRLSLIFFLPLLIASFLCSSCEKEAVLTPMAAFYEESAGLPQESLDSIKSFTAKFGSYVVCRPESRQDQYYQPTLDNINYAASLYGYRLVEHSVGVTINTDWDGETHLTY